MTIEPTNKHLQEACDLLNAGQVSGFELPEDQRHYAVVAIARIIANQQPAYPPELVERAFAFIRKVGVDVGLWATSEAKAIIAELDALKPDPLVEALAGLIPIIDYDPPETPAEAVAKHLRAQFHITEIRP